MIEKALANRKHALTTVTTNDDGPNELMDVPLDRPVREENAVRWYFPKQTDVYKVSLPLAQWLHTHIGLFDVVHIHALFSFSSSAAMWYARRKQVPYIVRPLGVLNKYGRARKAHLKNFSINFLERPLLRSAAALHFTSEQEHTETMELDLGVPVFEIPIGVDADNFRSAKPETFFAEWPVARDRRFILFLSRLDPVKGIEELLRAFVEVRSSTPDVLLVIAGAGEAEYVQSLRELTDRLHIADSVVWTGALDSAQKASAMAAAEIFVQPSYSESFGLSAAEALVAGCATILTTGVGLSHLAMAHDAALIAEPTAASLAAQITVLLGALDLRSRLRRNAERLAAKHLTVSAMGERLEKMYSTVTRK